FDSIYHEYQLLCCRLVAHGGISVYAVAGLALSWTVRQAGDAGNLLHAVLCDLVGSVFLRSSVFASPHAAGGGDGCQHRTRDFPTDFTAAALHVAALR